MAKRIGRKRQKPGRQDENVSAGVCQIFMTWLTASMTTVETAALENSSTHMDGLFASIVGTAIPTNMPLKPYMSLLKRCAIGV